MVGRLVNGPNAQLTRLVDGMGILRTTTDPARGRRLISRPLRIRVWSVLAVISTALACSRAASGSASRASPTAGSPEPDTVATTTPLRGSVSYPSSRVPAGEIVGTVIDASTRRPMEMVSISDATQRNPSTVTPLSTLTNARGQFRVRAEPGASVTLLVRRIGHAPVRVAVTMPRTMGSVVLVPLPLWAGCITEYEPPTPPPIPPSVTVHLATVAPVDSTASHVVVTTRYADKADSVTVRLDGSGRTTVRLGPGMRADDYEVTVSGPRFRTWTGRASATLDQTRCPHQFLPAEFHAWLFPR